MPSSPCPLKATRLRAIIAEDEAPLAMILEKSLRQLWPELTIVDVFSEGKSAQQALIDDPTDIAFLDIAMPYRTGIEIAEFCLSNNINTLIVLVTAYPEHALDAFKFNVCDYLLKPLCKTRLSETIERLKMRLKEHKRSAEKKTIQYIPVQKGTKKQLINIDNVCCFVSDQKYVKVVTAEATFLISKTLNELEKQLDEQFFWRIHRNSIVNIKKIQHSKKNLNRTSRINVT